MAMPFKGYFTGFACKAAGSPRRTGILTGLGVSQINLEALPGKILLILTFSIILSCIIFVIAALLSARAEGNFTVFLNSAGFFRGFSFLCHSEHSEESI